MSKIQNIHFFVHVYILKVKIWSVHTTQILGSFKVISIIHFTLTQQCVCMYINSNKTQSIKSLQRNCLQFFLGKGFSEFFSFSVFIVQEEDDDRLMIEWFELVNNKNELVRKEGDLIYM